MHYTFLLSCFEHWSPSLLHDIFIEIEGIRDLLKMMQKCGEQTVRSESNSSLIDVVIPLTSRKRHVQFNRRQLISFDGKLDIQEGVLGFVTSDFHRDSGNLEVSRLNGMFTKVSWHMPKLDIWCRVRPIHKSNTHSSVKPQEVCRTEHDLVLFGCTDIDVIGIHFKCSFSKSFHLC